ncbi:hypothetical protein RCH22_003337 [Cryobacterium psychrotolerans]|nr:hypothetical protein [Cryobacterium psychrotolerans]
MHSIFAQLFALAVVSVVAAAIIHFSLLARGKDGSSRKIRLVRRWLYISASVGLITLVVFVITG